ncbi:MAG: MATE family efflux transporter [Phycisphaeraceae bacterium]|nr:MATE family efflux transporter [Phycisphaeraceae bacterium]
MPCLGLGGGELQGWVRGYFEKAVSWMEAARREVVGSHGQILRLAGPLILSSTSVMLMNVVDGLFLAHYDTRAIAAVGPAGMTFWTMLGLFMGLCGYTNTFVAQYVGAGRPGRVGAAVWQGMYIGLAAGVVLGALAGPVSEVFRHLGHPAEVAELEVVYFRILAWFSVLYLVGSALSGFFAGRHDNVTLMVAQFAGAGVNAVLDWGLIFGKWGLPEMGMAGAAWATVIGHGVIVGVLGVLFLRRRHRERFGTWVDRGIDWGLMRRMARYGFPNGVRFVIEIVAWTAFMLILGRLGERALAASNIVWRINGMAFFPVIGLSTAIAMLVGQAQGAGRPDESARVAWRGLVMAEVWMVTMAAAFVLAPRALVGMFLGSSGVGAGEYE